MARTVRPAEMEKTRISTAGTRGFTLLELIVVLFIAGMAAAVVIFSAGRIRDNAVFRDEAMRHSQTLKHAREVAIMERTDVSVKLDADKNSYWIDYGEGKTSAPHVVPAGYSLTGKDVFFFSNGSSSGGTLKIENAKDQTYEIDVDPVMGTPKVKRL
jgi:general secretion pathway protein H